MKTLTAGQLLRVVVVVTLIGTTAGCMTTAEYKAMQAAANAPSPEAQAQVALQQKMKELYSVAENFLYRVWWVLTPEAEESFNPGQSVRYAMTEDYGRELTQHRNAQVTLVSRDAIASVWHVASPDGSEYQYRLLTNRAIVAIWFRDETGSIVKYDYPEMSDRPLSLPSLTAHSEPAGSQSVETPIGTVIADSYVTARENVAAIELEIRWFSLEVPGYLVREVLFYPEDIDVQPINFFEPGGAQAAVELPWQSVARSEFLPVEIFEGVKSPFGTQ